MTPDIRGVGSTVEREAVRALLRTEFEVAPGVGAAFADLYDSLLNLDISVGPDCSRVAVERNKVIGHALLAPRTIRACGGDCPAGLVGLVVVHPDFRGMGVGSALLDDIHALALQRGLGLLVLAGDRGYYRRFGYRDAFVKSECVLTVEASTSSKPTSFSTAHTDDINSLVGLSVKFCPPGSVSPTRERWDWILRTHHPAGLLKTNPAMLGHITDDDRLLIDDSGYARVALGKHKATVYEGGATAGRENRMLDQLIAICASEGISELVFRLSAENGLMRATGQLPTTTPDDEFQFKVIDLDVLLKAAQPGLEVRIGRDFPDWRGSLLIYTESRCILVSRESGVLEIRNVSETRGAGGSLGSIRVPEWGVGRILIGQDDIVKALTRGRSATDFDRVLDSLFSSALPEFLLSDAI